MSAREFRKDEVGYQTWVTNNPDGFVINIRASYNPTDARRHRADCRFIRAQIGAGSTQTGSYVKVCAKHLADIEHWEGEHVGASISWCRTATCRPDRQAAQPGHGLRDSRSAAGPVIERRPTIRGPLTGEAVVDAWADAYIRFDERDRPDWQHELVAEIKTRSGQLVPTNGEVLHASFYGDKRSDADVENVVLYYIDTFAVAGGNGIRFEHGATAPATPDGDKYEFCYRYALVPRSGGFTDWQQGRTLASFGWTDLDEFKGDKLAALVWWAVRRGPADAPGPVCAPETPFAVRIEVKPPHKHQRVWGNLVKGVVDGVISAFQYHSNPAVVPQVAARLSPTLRADPAEIEAFLLDQTRAVLGPAFRLVSLHGEGVQWNPSDHCCAAGELLRAEPENSRWAIKGEIVPISRRPG